MTATTMNVGLDELNESINDSDRGYCLIMCRLLLVSLYQRRKDAKEVYWTSADSYSRSVSSVLWVTPIQSGFFSGFSSDPVSIRSLLIERHLETVIARQVKLFKPVTGLF